MITVKNSGGVSAKADTPPLSTLSIFLEKWFARPGQPPLPLVPLKQIHRIHLVRHIRELVAPAVGDDRVAAGLEGLQVVGHLGAEELWRVLRGLVDHHGHALGLHALHDALDGARAELDGAQLRDALRRRADAGCEQPLTVAVAAVRPTSARLVDHGDQPIVHYLLGKAPEQVAHVDGAAVEPGHGEHVQRRVKEDLRSGILPFLETAVVVISESRTRADLR